MMSGLPSAFAMLCNTTVSDPVEESKEKDQSEKHPFLASSSLPKANGDDISSNFDELKAAFNIKSDRLNEHITPQDYKHSMPPPPVKYMLDYTLNRFTR